MNFLSNLTPMLALAIAQFDASEAKLSVYGPMGIICMWLMWRDEKRAREAEKNKEADRLENAKTREEIGNVAHQMKGLNRNLLYVTATHGPSPLREVAQRELERIQD